MTVMAGPKRRGCHTLAKIVAEGGEANRQIRRALTGLIQHHHGVDAGIDLRVPLGGCRHPEQGVQLGEERLEGTTFAQYLEEDPGSLPQQYLLQLLPDPLRGQVGKLAGVGHLPHQRQRLGGHHEALLMETGGEARHPQDAQGILGKGRRDMAQQPRLQILHAAVGIVQLPVLIFGDGVDGEIPAQQILLQRHLGGGMTDEACITQALFALGARQGILLLGAGVEKHRKVATNLGEPEAQHLLHGSTDHQVVSVPLRQSQQAITDRSPNQINLHAHSPSINLPR